MYLDPHYLYTLIGSKLGIGPERPDDKLAKYIPYPRVMEAIGAGLIGDVPFARKLLRENVREMKPEGLLEKTAYWGANIGRYFIPVAGQKAAIGKGLLGADKALKATKYLGPAKNVAYRALTSPKIPSIMKRGAIIGAATADTEDPVGIAQGAVGGAAGHLAFHGALKGTGKAIKYGWSKTPESVKQAAGRAGGKVLDALALRFPETVVSPDVMTARGTREIGRFTSAKIAAESRKAMKAVGIDLDARPELNPVFQDRFNKMLDAMTTGGQGFYEPPTDPVHRVMDEVSRKMIRNLTRVQRVVNVQQTKAPKDPLSEHSTFGEWLKRGWSRMKRRKKEYLADVDPETLKYTRFSDLDKSLTKDFQVIVEAASRLKDATKLDRDMLGMMRRINEAKHAKMAALRARSGNMETIETLLPYHIEGKFPKSLGAQFDALSPQDRAVMDQMKEAWGEFLFEGNRILNTVFKGGLDPTKVAMKGGKPDFTGRLPGLWARKENYVPHIHVGSRSELWRAFEGKPQKLAELSQATKKDFFNKVETIVAKDDDVILDQLRHRAEGVLKTLRGKGGKENLLNVYERMRFNLYSRYSQEKFIQSVVSKPDRVAYFNPGRAYQEDPVYLGFKKKGWKEVKFYGQGRPRPEADLSGKMRSMPPPDSIIVHPDIYREVNAVLSPEMRNRPLDVIRFINSLSKQAGVTAQGYNATALLETSAGIKDWRGMGKGLNLKQFLKGLKDPLEMPAHQQSALTRQALRAGLGMSGVDSFERSHLLRTLNYLTDWGESRGGVVGKVVGKAFKGVHDVVNLNTKFMFNHMHNNLKLSAFEKLYSEMIALPQFKDIPRALIEQEVAASVNKMFGGLAWDVLGKSRNWVNFTSLGILSPDWNLAAFAQALMPLGVGAKSKATQDVMKKMGRDFWTRVSLFSVAGTQMMNYALSHAYTGIGRFTWDNPKGKETYVYWGQEKDGGERYVRFGKQFRELPALLVDPLRTVGVKASPIVKQVYSQATGQVLGMDVPTEIGKQEGSLVSRLTEVGKMFVPYSMQSAARSDFWATTRAMRFALGVRRGLSIFDARKQVASAIESKGYVPEDLRMHMLNNNLDPDKVERQVRNPRSARDVPLVVRNKFRKARLIWINLRHRDAETQQRVISMLYDQDPQLGAAVRNFLRDDAVISRKRQEALVARAGK